MFWVSDGADPSWVKTQVNLESIYDITHEMNVTTAELNIYEQSTQVISLNMQFNCEWSSRYSKVIRLQV